MFIFTGHSGSTERYIILEMLIGFKHFHNVIAGITHVEYYLFIINTGICDMLIYCPLFTLTWNLSLVGMIMVAFALIAGHNHA